MQTSLSTERAPESDRSKQLQYSALAENCLLLAVRNSTLLELLNSFRKSANWRNWCLLESCDDNFKNPLNRYDGIKLK